MDNQTLKQEYKQLKKEFPNKVKFTLKEYIESRTKGNYSLDAIKQRLSYMQ